MYSALTRPRFTRLRLGLASASRLARLAPALGLCPEVLTLVLTASGSRTTLGSQDLGFWIGSHGREAPRSTAPTASKSAPPSATGHACQRPAHVRPANVSGMPEGCERDVR
eukprot:737344-Rhodomonas_salina.1